MKRGSAPPESGPRLVRREAPRLGPPATVRLDRDVIARIDAIAAGRSTPGHEVTRAEVLRELIENGLPVVTEAALAAVRRRHIGGAAHPLLVVRGGGMPPSPAADDAPVVRLRRPRG